MCVTEKTLIIKNAVSQVNNKGMIPIEKNISVIDENGNEYEATYPKRAKGLVKKGRARFVDDNTICLACPPDITEDTNMSDNKNVNVNVNANEETLNVGYILKQMAAIQQDNAHIYEALNTLTAMQQGNIGGPGAPEDISGQAKATAIADVVRCRETTNQKLLAFYEKVYDDLKPQKSVKKAALEVLSQAVNRNYSDPEPDQIANLAEALSSAFDGIRHIGPADQEIDDAVSRAIENSVNDAVNKAIEESISKSIEESISQEFYDPRP